MSIQELYKLYLKSDGVEIDSRLIHKNKLFFALKGQHVDGHQYVKALMGKQNVFAVIDNDEYYINEKTILVDDVLKCLQELSTHHRQQLNIPVLGITGSNGKTTTKELVQTVLDQKYKVYATKGNYNNHLGVPLTLLSTPLDTEILIVEMGANHIGDIDELCNIAYPNYGLITNIGYAHIEGFGSYEGVIKTKTELYRFIKTNGGQLFINADDTVLNQNLPDGIETITYPNPDLKIEDNGLSLKILYKEFEEHTSLLYGIYNATNIQVAFAVGKHFGVSDIKMLRAIEDYVPEMNRSQIKEIGSTTFIMDAYNANPSSMKLSIESLGKLKSDKKKILILGDMKELGEDEISFHREMLVTVSKYSWSKIYTVGKIFSQIENETVSKYPSVDSLIDEIKQENINFEDAIVLLKASRSIQLEKVLNECFTDKKG